MKHFKHSVLLSCMAGLACMASCDNERDFISEENSADEYIEVGIGQLLTPTVTPLTKASTEGDLYGLTVSSGLMSACVLDQDLSDKKIRLKKGDYTVMNIIYVPNGQNILHHEGNVYGYPFAPDPTMYGNQAPEFGHDVYYDSNYKMTASIYGIARRTGKDASMAANLWNNVPIFYGATKFFANNDTIVHIDLYEMKYGLSITAKNFKEGELRVYPKGYGINSWSDVEKYGTNAYIITPDKPTLDVVHAPIIMPRAIYPEDVKYHISEEPIVIEYVSPEGQVTRIHQGTYICERMMKYEFTIDVEELLQNVNGGIHYSPVIDKWQTADISTANDGRSWFLRHPPVQD